MKIQFTFFLALMAAIILLIMVAKKIKIAYPVLLVVAGLLISLIPGIPLIPIDPELIFIIFLPPLLFDAAWSISWKELWRWRRVIFSFAFVVVFLTACSVAFVANHFIPGFSLPLGFLLGAIVSPPDAVSVGAILKFVKVPTRMASILEGESLLNDASSLIIFRFAFIAVATGQFVWQEAALSFGWMVLGGVGAGLLVGWIFMKAHKYLPTDANMDIILSIISPYVMYMAAEEMHSSGVLAVVCGGLLLSYKRHYYLNSTSRLRGINFWSSLSFVLNGLVFTLIGLDLPVIVAGLGGVSIVSAVGYGVLITGVLIVGRILAAYGAVGFTLIARNFITVADSRNPGWKGPLLIGWSGMRGVVSLAAALSIPVQLSANTAFPQRNLILFITFVVILLTLLIQGLTLPFLIRKINLPNRDGELPDEEKSLLIRQGLAEFSLEYLSSNHKEALATYPMLQQMAQKWRDRSATTTDKVEMAEACKSVCRELLNQQRKWLLNKNKQDKELNEEIIRKQLSQLDLEEEKLRFA